MTKSKHKQALFRDLAVIIHINDDLCPEEFFGDDNPEYKKWNEARNELIEEFERRASAP